MYILQRMKTNKLILTLSILSILTIVSVSPVFAIDNCDQNLTVQFEDTLKRLLNMFSWLRLPLATLAGKLMGNGFIYGEFFNLDKILYSLWGMSRTFANYLVGILILYTLSQKLLTEENFNGPEMMKYILKMWGGVILANMSWFLIGATIDVSTILTTTVAAFPSTFVAQDSKAKDYMLQTIKTSRWQYTKTIHLGKTCKDAQKLESQTPLTDTNTTIETDQEILDKILPQKDSITWPLMYIGIGVLKVQDFIYDANESWSAMNDIFIVSTRLAIVWLFFTIILVLLIINIFRIVTIWFAVSFAPLLIIAYFWDYLDSIEELKKFSLGNIIKSIFAPVIAVGLMSIGLIVIVIMQGFLQSSQTAVSIDNINLQSSQDGSSIGVDGIFNTTIQGDIFEKKDGNAIKNTFTDILMIILTLFILYGISQALSKFMSWTRWDETIQTVSTLSSNALSSIPMIPLPWGWKTNFHSLSKTANEQYENIRSKFTSKNNGDTVIENAFRKKLGLKPILDTEAYNWLHKLTKSFEWKTLWSSHYNSMIKEYNNEIIDHYRKENISIKQIDSNSNTLSTFFKNIANTKIEIDWTTTNPFWAWKQGETTIETFIKENYNTNKKFFEKVYTDMGWDATKITTGDDFWTKNIIRKE